MNGVDQFLARESVNPRLIRVAASANLGDDNEAIGIGMKCLLDDLIRHMRAVKVAGVDVINASRDGLAKNGECSIHVARRSPHLWTGQAASRHTPCGLRSSKCRGR